MSQSYLKSSSDLNHSHYFPILIWKVGIKGNLSPSCQTWDSVKPQTPKPPGPLWVETTHPV